MGAGTNKKIDDCNKALSEVVDAIDANSALTQACNKVWGDMMTAYDSNGCTKQPKFKGPLEKAVSDCDAGRALIRTKFKTATDEVADFEAYVIAKDKKTINPLAKKSIGKAKKFIKNAKTELDGLKIHVPGPVSPDILKIAKEYYV